MQTQIRDPGDRRPLGPPPAPRSSQWVSREWGSKVLPTGAARDPLLPPYASRENGRVGRPITDTGFVGLQTLSDARGGHAPARRSTTLSLVRMATRRAAQASSARRFSSR